MNYAREALALIDRMIARPLTAHEIALWHALAAISARCGKSEGLSVPMDLLKVYTGSSKDSVERARNGLKTKGLIDWQSQRGRKAPLYTIYSVAEQIAAQSTPQHTPQHTQMCIRDSLCAFAGNGTKSGKSPLAGAKRSTTGTKPCAGWMMCP